MAPAKKAPDTTSNQRPISHFFQKPQAAPLPIEPVVDLTELPSPMASTAHKKGSCELPIAIPDSPVQRKQQIVQQGDPQRKKHSFFDRFDERKRKYAEQAAADTEGALYIKKIRELSLSKAPIFPSIIGTVRERAPVLHIPVAWPSRSSSFDLTEYSSKIRPCAFDPPWNCEESHGPRPVSYKQIDAVYNSILTRLRNKELPPEDPYGSSRRWHWHDEEDDDDWLPSGFRALRAHSTPQENSLRQVHLVSGPTGTGKSHLAARLAEELNAPLVEVSTVGNGPNGERTAKPFDDLLVCAENRRIGKDRGLDEDGQIVVLLDEIDLVFGNDKSFITGLCNYIQRASSKHIVIMTSNAPFLILQYFYAFPLDIIVHELKDEEPVQQDQTLLSFTETESRSIFDVLASSRQPPEHEVSPILTCINYAHHSPTCVTQKESALREIMQAYSIRAASNKLLVNLPLSQFATSLLPTWSLLERHQAEAEEERQLRRRRRVPSSATAIAYLRGNLPASITDLVRQWQL